ncbi:MAG: DUF5662 family protein [Rickettsiales bacterium]|jgi:hypothetical protein|nr:DUF5662 family protein [Rickettsiales bacterium]
MQNNKTIIFDTSIDLSKYTNNAMLTFATERVIAHKNLVNKLAKKINREYPNHDDDKLSGNMHQAYGILWKIYPDTEQTIFPERIFLEAKKHQSFHRLLTPHHTDYWKNENSIDASKMPTEYLEEMCCDWVAASIYDNENLIQWLGENINKQFSFSKSQLDFIYKTIDILKA